MAAKGSESKDILQNYILQNLNGAFLNGKELRVPFMENGERIEIKVSLTCAKDNIRNDVVAPNETKNTATNLVEIAKPEPIPLTEDEQNLVKDLASLFNI